LAFFLPKKKEKRRKEKRRKEKILERETEFLNHNSTEPISAKVGGGKDRPAVARENPDYVNAYQKIPEKMIDI